MSRHKDLIPLIPARPTSGLAARRFSFSPTPPNGKRQTVIDGEGNRAKLTYDGHDRLLSWNYGGNYGDELR